jgi:hypothetical protein
MHFVMRRWFRLFIALVAIGCSFSAQAAYHFVTVDCPGAISTQLWGINDSGQVVGQAQHVDAGPFVSFIYDLKIGACTPIPGVPDNTGLIGINDSGVMVGGQTDTSGNEHGVIFKNGMLTTFSHPGFANTEARGIGDSGLVTGWAFNLDSTDTITSSIAFIYDPTHHSFTDFFPSTNQRSNIAQGINAQNQVVGSTPVPATPGPAATYGYLRNTNGALTLFQVNNGGVNNLPTRGRGINDAGRITGFVTAPPDGNAKGFVGSLSGASSPQMMVIPDAQLLAVPDPAAVNTIPQGIDKFEHLVGAWDDGDVSHGFIATLVATDKDRCKNSGWQTLVRADGTTFKNQGDCIQYVNTGK